MSKLFTVCKVQLTALILACIFLAAPSAFADVPMSLTQQGRLLTADGQPMRGAKTLLFELYDAATGGEVLWSDQFEVDLGDSGFYTAILGSSDNPLDHTVLQGGPTFMQLVIDDKPLLPRLELTSVPYAQIAQMAHQAKHAESATHAETAGSALTAGLADSVKPGSINTASIANNAVTAEKISSIPWSKITQQPTIPTYTGSDFVTSNQNCTTAGQMVTGISALGKLVCATPTDNDTKYTAGNGLNLSGTSFSIAPNGVTDQNIVGVGWAKVTGKPEITNFTSSAFVKSGASCTGTQFFRGFNADGTLLCGQPTDTNTTYTVQAGQGLSINNNQFGVATSGILSGHIADGAVTSAKVAQNGIQSGHIANGSITSAKIATGGIQSDHIANGAITSAKIENPVIIYQVTSGACDNQGSITTSPACANIESCSNICGSGPIGSSLVPHRRCNGVCGCTNPILITDPNDCPNTPLGHLIP